MMTELEAKNKVSQKVKIKCQFKNPVCPHASNPSPEGADCDGEDGECENAFTLGEGC